MISRLENLFCDLFELTPTDICWRVVAFTKLATSEILRLKKEHPRCGRHEKE